MMYFSCKTISSIIAVCGTYIRKLFKKTETLTEQYVMKDDKREVPVNIQNHFSFILSSYRSDQVIVVFYVLSIYGNVS